MFMNMHKEARTVTMPTGGPKEWLYVRTLWDAASGSSSEGSRRLRGVWGEGVEPPSQGLEQIHVIFQYLIGTSSKIL